MWDFPFSISFRFNLTLYFCSTLKRHSSFQNENNRKPHKVLLPDLWFLSYNKKFNDICVGWTFRKTDLVINYLNLWNLNFANVVFLNSYLTFLYLITPFFVNLFSSLIWISNIPLLNNLFISFLHLLISLTRFL